MNATLESYDVDDPIEEAFPVMLDAARRLCGSSAGSDDSCFKYHRARAYTRRLGFHSVIPGSPYYIDTFRGLARSGTCSNVLISGTADYNMLGNVVHAYRAEGVEPRVTVLDRCDTPLYVNRWYAERQRASIDTVKCDILEFDGNSAFDVVTTDHFLTRIRPDDRATLLDVWRRSLREDGKVVTTEPIPRETLPSGPRIRTAEQIEGSRARVLDSLRALEWSLDVPPETAADYVVAYHAIRVAHPIRSIEELTRLFEEHGFAIDTVVRIPRRKSDRIHLVASRR